MSDFDKYFADRLNEESEFPNQGENWNALSKRLDAYAAGNLGGTSYLRFWKLAAASLVAIAAYLVWEIQHTRAENKDLRAEVAQWRASYQAAGPAAELLPGEGLGRDATDEMASAASPAFPPTALSLPGLPSRQPELSHTSSPRLNNARIAEAPTGHTRQAKNIHTAAHTPGAAPAQGPSTDNNTAYAQSNTPSVVPSAPSTDNTAAPQPGQSAEQPGTTVPASAVTDPSAPATDPAPATTAMAYKPAAPLALLPAPEPPLPASTAERTIQWPAVPPAPAMAPEEIRPQHQKPARFRAGAQLLRGQLQPKVEGISALKGAGVALEYRPVGQFWVTASADWLSQPVCVQKNLPLEIYPDKPPKPFSQHHELVNIEASPKQQQYSLGLRYVVPLRFFIRPSVRVAHSWVHVSPGIFTFEFEDKDPGPGPGPGHHDPEYYITRPEARWHSNIWRVGAALEVEARHWVFSLGADYSRNLGASQPAPHAVLAQASAQFAF